MQAILRWYTICSIRMNCCHHSLYTINKNATQILDLWLVHQLSADNMRTTSWSRSVATLVHANDWMSTQCDSNAVGEETAGSPVHSTYPQLRRCGPPLFFFRARVLVVYSLWETSHCVAVERPKLDDVPKNCKQTPSTNVNQKHMYGMWFVNARVHWLCVSVCVCTCLYEKRLQTHDTGLQQGVFNWPPTETTKTQTTNSCCRKS